MIDLKKHNGGMQESGACTEALKNYRRRILSRSWLGYVMIQIIVMIT